MTVQFKGLLTWKSLSHCTILKVWLLNREVYSRGRSGVLCTEVGIRICHNG